MVAPSSHRSESYAPPSEFAPGSFELAHEATRPVSAAVKPAAGGGRYQQSGRLLETFPEDWPQIDRLPFAF